jgi:two-component system chemotaxis response regulator CheB
MSGVNSQIIAIGASTGGTIALESVLSRLPSDIPPIVIVQHTLPSFSKALADRLDSVCHMHVVETVHGESLAPGVAYIAPGSVHLLVESEQRELRAVLRRSHPVHYHRPSVDVLFRSLLTVGKVDVVAVLLTGMGRDGADGMLALRQAGARTIAQDERSSVVFGMPKEAIENGAAQYVASLNDLPRCIMECLTKAPPRARWQDRPGPQR